MLIRAPRDLSVESDSTIRVYAEVYGLPRAADGTARYDVSYQIVESTNLARDAARDALPGGIVISFDRVSQSPEPMTREWLDLRPDIAAGRYLLRLTVRTSPSGALVGRSQVGFEVREQ
jgi:hypothetical protein